MLHLFIFVAPVLHLTKSHKRQCLLGLFALLHMKYDPGGGKVEESQS